MRAALELRAGAKMLMQSPLRLVAASVLWVLGPLHGLVCITLTFMCAIVYAGGALATGRSRQVRREDPLPGW